jgi:hypothetical protein
MVVLLLLLVVWVLVVPALILGLALLGNRAQSHAAQPRLPRRHTCEGRRRGRNPSDSAVGRGSLGDVGTLLTRQTARARSCRSVRTAFRPHKRPLP